MKEEGGRKTQVAPRGFPFTLPPFSLIFLCLLVSGCAGYALGPAKPEFLKDVHRIAVPTFRNNTLQPRLESLVATSLVRQLQQDGTYEIVNEETADAVLIGTIEKVNRTPARSVRGNVLLTQEFTLTIGLRYQLVERGTKKVLDIGRAEGQTNFFVSGDVQQDERQAIPLATERAVVRLTSQLTEGF